MSRVVAHLLIAAALVLAQLGALEHAIAHVFQHGNARSGSDFGHKSKTPHSVFCEHWLSYAGAQAATDSHGPCAVSTDAGFEQVVHYAIVAPSVSVRLFDSRAPPLLH